MTTSLLRFRRALFPAAVVLGLTSAGCRESASSHGNAKPWFRDVAETSGIRFVHRTGHTDASLPVSILQTTGSGCGFLDFDGDGFLDVFLLGGDPKAGGKNALFRNLEGRRFERVPVSEALERSYAMGCAVADVDEDGDLDIYLCNYGANQLFRNRGGGAFEDVIQESGAVVSGWSTAASFFDADGDQHLDLYVVRYARFSAADPQVCGKSSCQPTAYPAATDVFFRNTGRGRFRNATREFGFSDLNGRGLGVLAGDLDGDGRPEVFVPNDMTNNYLFRHHGARFEDVALVAGVAFGPRNRAEASMGCDSADFDGDGRFDLLFANFENESDGLYRQLPGGVFDYATPQSNLGELTRNRLGFGIGFVDFDNDGDPDIVQANGHVNNLPEALGLDGSYRQPRQLLRNQGDGRFEECTQEAGPAFSNPAVGRGLAFGDYDNDGRVDILVSDNNGPAAVLHNETPNAGHWLTVRLKGSKRNRLAIGAQVTIEAGGKRQIREVRSSNSYCSVSDLRLHFGLGASQRVDRLEVRWPSSKRTELGGVAVDQVLDLSHP